MVLTKSKSAWDPIRFSSMAMKRGQSGDDLAFMAQPWRETSTARQALGRRWGVFQLKKTPDCVPNPKPVFFLRRD